MALDVSGEVVGTAATTVGSLLLMNIVGVFLAHYPKHPSGSIARSGAWSFSGWSTLSVRVTGLSIPLLLFPFLCFSSSFFFIPAVLTLFVYLCPCAACRRHYPRLDSRAGFCFHKAVCSCAHLLQPWQSPLLGGLQGGMANPHLGNR